MAFETLSQDEARLHLIAHAPQTIPDWFKPEMPERPSQMNYMANVFGKHSGHKHESFFRDHYNDETGEWEEGADIPEELKREVADYIVKLEENISALNKWDRQNKIEHSIQWPIFWADQILSKLNAD